MNLILFLHFLYEGNIVLVVWLELNVDRVLTLLESLRLLMGKGSVGSLSTKKTEKSLEIIKGIRKGQDLICSMVNEILFVSGNTILS